MLCVHRAVGEEFPSDVVRIAKADQQSPSRHRLNPLRGNSRLPEHRHQPSKLGWLVDGEGNTIQSDQVFTESVARWSPRQWCMKDQPSTLRSKSQAKVVLSGQRPIELQPEHSLVEVARPIWVGEAERNVMTSEMTMPCPIPRLPASLGLRSPR
jgi:hypothetical protein